MTCCRRRRRTIVALALCLPVLVPAGAGAVSITAFNQGPPQTSPLTPGPPLPGRTEPGYRFNLADYFPVSRNALPLGMFTETEFETILALLAGPADPIVVKQTIEFEIRGEFWLHHYTIELSPSVFPIASFDTVHVFGFIQHLVAPHPQQNENAPGPKIALDATADAGSALTLPPGSGPGAADRLVRELARSGLTIPSLASLGVDLNSLPHDNGTDEDAALLGVVGARPGALTVTFELVEILSLANHPQDVPEPPVLALLAAGIVIAAGLGAGKRARAVDTPAPWTS